MTAPTFYFTDGAIHVWREDPDDPDTRKTFVGVNRLLRRLGFDVTECSHTRKHYASLSLDTRVGRFGDLEFNHRASDRCQELEFFQNVSYDNPNGGRYDFQKESRMPYLVRLRYLWTRQRVAEYLAGRGIEQSRDYVPRTALDFIAHRRATCWHWKDRPGRMRVPEGYNSRSADERQLADGMRVYFYDRAHRLGVGRAFYNLNNMWWIVVGSNPRPRNIANFDIFVENKNLPRKRWRNSDRRIRIEKQYKAAIERLDFERAAKLRDVLGLKPQRESSCA